LAKHLFYKTACRKLIFKKEELTTKNDQKKCSLVRQSGPRMHTHCKKQLPTIMLSFVLIVEIKENLKGMIG